MENSILDKGFWKNILNYLEGIFFPKVLWMIDSDEESTMGFIYEEMNIAKRGYKIF